MSERARYRPHELGSWGERLAETRLLREGWRLLARGYRLGRREIDLIVRREDTLAFVEVKTRSGSGFGRPEEAVTWRKRREIEAVASAFLLTYRHDVLRVRFDVISITVDRLGRLRSYRHIEDAWRPG